MRITARTYFLLVIAGLSFLLCFALYKGIAIANRGQASQPSRIQQEAVRAYDAVAVTDREQNWQLLSNLVSQEKLRQIVEENTGPSANRGEIANAARGYEQDGLLIVDFNNPSLCGFGGCAIAGYLTSTGERILSAYVIRPSADAELVELIVQEDNALPCLTLTSRDSRTSSSSKVICYRNQGWVESIISASKLN